MNWLGSLCSALCIPKPNRWTDANQIVSTLVTLYRIVFAKHGLTFWRLAGWRCLWCILNAVNRFSIAWRAHNKNKLMCCDDDLSVYVIEYVFTQFSTWLRWHKADANCHLFHWINFIVNKVFSVLSSCCILALFFACHSNQARCWSGSKVTPTQSVSIKRGKKVSQFIHRLKMFLKTHRNVWMTT